MGNYCANDTAKSDPVTGPQPTVRQVQAKMPQPVRASRRQRRCAGCGTPDEDICFACQAYGVDRGNGRRSYFTYI